MGTRCICDETLELQSVKITIVQSSKYYIGSCLKCKRYYLVTKDIDRESKTEVSMTVVDMFLKDIEQWGEHERVDQGISKGVR